MFSVYKKELSYYLNNPLGYIIIILFAVFANFLYVKDMFVVGLASMRSFFSLIPWLFLIFIPALSMRSISEEKRTNTIETLLALPLSETQIILAKFLALVTVMSIALMLTGALPVALFFLKTRVYIPEVIIGYIGTVLLGTFFIALSLFFSSLSKNQVVALLASIITIFCLLVIGGDSDFFSNLVSKTVADFLSYFSPLYHLQNFMKGVIDIRSIFYFVSGTLLFLFLSIIDLENRD
jgi:ABC-2 type transport system permease protein